MSEMGMEVCARGLWWIVECEWREREHFDVMQIICVYIRLVCANSTII